MLQVAELLFGQADIFQNAEVNSRFQLSCVPRNHGAASVRVQQDPMSTFGCSFLKPSPQQFTHDLFGFRRQPPSPLPERLLVLPKTQLHRASIRRATTLWQVRDQSRRLESVHPTRSSPRASLPEHQLSSPALPRGSPQTNERRARRELHRAKRLGRVDPEKATRCRYTVSLHHRSTGGAQ
jgi:hypothetical protein